jgi:dTDP-4-dehydrorhamnose 3,5-epimerase
MIFRETGLAGAYLIDLERHVDDRGFFARAWCRDEFAAHGLAMDIVQSNVSFSPVAGTLRGLHYQRPPHWEAKLVQCVRGAIYDVIVDLRPESRTYRRWFAVELTADARQMLYVPERFAHGFQTLKPDTEVSYMMSAAYVPEAGCGIRYDDPELGIEWPLPVSRIGARDRSWPTLHDQEDLFATRPKIVSTSR